MNFDRHARQYDFELEKGIRLSGEEKEYFVRGRLHAVRDYFRQAAMTPGRMIEFGCGIGTNIGVVRELWPEVEITGLDVSEQSLQVARSAFGGMHVRFMTPEALRQRSEDPVDWVICNGVFHHIPPLERSGALALIRSLLRPGGLFTLFDNNPFNPGARLVMRRIPFDRDAEMVSPYRLMARLPALGYRDISCRFLFVFPRFLSFLRFLERPLAPLPLGAQYGVFARADGE